MNNNEFLFYADFRGNPDRPFFTLLGGIKTTKLILEKEPVQTMDYTQDYQMLIPGSGVLKAQISGSGYLENYLEQFDKLLSAHLNTALMPLRLSNGPGGLSITAPFIISSIIGDSDANTANLFSITLISGGEVEVVNVK